MKEQITVLNKTNKSFVCVELVTKIMIRLNSFEWPEFISVSVSPRFDSKQNLNIPRTV